MEFKTKYVLPVPEGPETEQDMLLGHHLKREPLTHAFK